MIELDSIVRTYSDFELRVSFSVRNDELVTLLGPSGSGKTTTLRIIAGFESADGGSLKIGGTDVSRVPTRRRDIGYVFQDFTLFPHLNVGENIAYGLRVHKVARAERRRRVDELLELIGLAGFTERNVSTLSGGEKQRVAVARALARKPRALLLDEPFSSVDSERREGLLEYILRIQRNFQIPTVFVTHSRLDALAISDRIVTMQEGHIDDDGPPRRLYETPKTAYTARLLGTARFLDAAGRRFVRPERVCLRPSETASAHAAGGRGHRNEGAPSHNVAVDSTGDPGDGAPGRDIPSDTPIPGVVTRAIFRGGRHEYRVSTEFGELPVVTSELYETGAGVWVHIPEDAVVTVDR